MGPDRMGQGGPMGPQQTPTTTTPLRRAPSVNDVEARLTYLMSEISLTKLLGSRSRCALPLATNGNLAALMS